MNTNNKSARNYFKLDDEYFIDKDRYNIILVKKKVIKNENDEKKEIYKRIGFFRNLENAIHKYIDIKIKENLKVSKEINELLKNISELKKMINKKIENCKEIKNLKTIYEN